MDITKEGRKMKLLLANKENEQLDKADILRKALEETVDEDEAIKKKLNEYQGKKKLLRANERLDRQRDE